MSEEAVSGDARARGRSPKTGRKGDKREESATKRRKEESSERARARAESAERIAAAEASSDLPFTAGASGSAGEKPGFMRMGREEVRELLGQERQYVEMRAQELVSAGDPNAALKLLQKFRSDSEGLDSAPLLPVMCAAPPARPSWSGTDWVIFFRDRDREEGRELTERERDELTIREAVEASIRTGADERRKREELEVEERADAVAAEERARLVASRAAAARREAEEVEERLMHEEEELGAMDEAGWEAWERERSLELAARKKEEEVSERRRVLAETCREAPRAYRDLPRGTARLPRPAERHHTIGADGGFG